MDKRNLVLDFDGVLHSYKTPWEDAAIIPDDPVPGAVEFCQKAVETFQVWVISSRQSSPGGAKAIRKWLKKWGFPPEIVVPAPPYKPATFVTIDDRAITFKGVWPELDELLAFKSWLTK